jgi:hypothetical protein
MTTDHQIECSDMLRALSNYSPFDFPLSSENTLPQRAYHPEDLGLGLGLGLDDLSLPPLPLLPSFALPPSSQSVSPSPAALSEPEPERTIVISARKGSKRKVCEIISGANEPSPANTRLRPASPRPPFNSPSRGPSRGPTVTFTNSLVRRPSLFLIHGELLSLCDVYVFP